MRAFFRVYLPQYHIKIGIVNLIEYILVCCLVRVSFVMVMKMQDVRYEFQHFKNEVLLHLQQKETNSMIVDENLLSLL